VLSPSNVTQERSGAAHGPSGVGQAPLRTLHAPSHIAHARSDAVHGRSSVVQTMLRTAHSRSDSVQAREDAVHALVGHRARSVGHRAGLAEFLPMQLAARPAMIGA